MRKKIIITVIVIAIIILGILVMYSHHFRYRLEVGASCSIQLLL